MTIREIKEWLVVAAATGIISVVSACGLIPDEGVPVKGNYPELTVLIQQENSKEILEYVENDAIVVEDDSNCLPGKCARFDGAIKEYINYLYTFLQEDYGKKGIRMKGINENLKVHIIENISELSYCNAHHGGCYRGFDNIALSQHPVIKALRFFNHELHHDINNNEEFTSLAGEIYIPIKAYQFGFLFEDCPLCPSIGSLVLDDMMRVPIRSSQDELSARDYMYSAGALYALANLIENNGDIERAMDDIAHSRMLEIQIRLASKIAEYSARYNTNDQNVIYFHLWNDLLNLSGFREYLTSETGHLTETQADEVITYQKIANHLRLKGQIDKEEFVVHEEQLIDLLKDFASNPTNTNPFFRAKVAKELTKYLNLDLEKTIQESGRTRTQEVYDLSKRILELNNGYPCQESNPYECPKDFREIQEDHANAYYLLFSSAYLSTDVEHAPEITNFYADELIENSYPEIELGSGYYGILPEIERGTNNLLAFVTQLVGQYHFEEGNYELAKDYLTLCLNVNCTEENSYPTLQQCFGSQHYARDTLNEMQN